GALEGGQVLVEVDDRLPRLEWAFALDRTRSRRPASSFRTRTTGAPGVFGASTASTTPASVPWTRTAAPDSIPPTWGIILYPQDRGAGPGWERGRPGPPVRQYH